VWAGEYTVGPAVESMFAKTQQKNFRPEMHKFPGPALVYTVPITLLVA
jgi:hypothetical protein